VSPGQVARTNGGRAVGVLELVQNLKGFGQFFGRGRHNVSQLGFHVVLNLGYSVVSYLGYAVEDFLGFCAPAQARFRRRSRPPPPFTASNTTTAIFTIVGDVVVIDVIVIVVITTITPSWRCRLHRDHAATSSPVGAPRKPQFTCIRTANSSAPTGPKWWVAHLSRRPVVLSRISCGRPKRWTHRLS
jgi:hypothetical protein